MPIPDPRIAAYVAEVSVPGVPWISSSHITLRHINIEYGQATVQHLLDKHWAAMRSYAVALKRHHAHGLVESSS